MRTGAKDAQQVSAVPVRAVLRDRGMRVQLVVASWQAILRALRTRCVKLVTEWVE